MRAPSQRATQRAACHATNASAPASVASSIASSARSALGSAWYDRDRRLWARFLPAVQHPGPQPVAAGLLDHAVGQTPAAVAEHQLLPTADAPHGGGVEPVVTLDDGQLTGLGQRVDIEQAGHRQRVSAP